MIITPMLKRIFDIALLSFLTAIISFSANAATLGDRVRFVISDTFALPGQEEAVATVRFAGKHADLWIEDDLWTFFDEKKEREASELLRIFDEELYDKLISFWGTEANPGVDNDSKVSILLLNLQNGIAGFSSSADFEPARAGLLGNGREMFYVNAGILGRGAEKAVLAHEFQHVISFNQKKSVNGYREDTWVNELRSEYSSQLALGTIPEDRLRAFLKTPDDSLGEWKNDPANYGGVAVFAAYVASRFGSRVFPTIMSRPSIGIPSLEETFLIFSHNLGGFTEVFRDWVLANVFNRFWIADGRYGYRSNAFAGKKFIIPTPVSLSGAGAVYFSDRIKDWQPRVFSIRAQDDGEVVVSFSSRAKDSLMYLEQAVDRRDYIMHNPLWLSRRPDGKGESGLFRIAVKRGDEFILLFFNERKRVDFSSDDPSYPFELSLRLNKTS